MMRQVCYCADGAVSSASPAHQHTSVCFLHTRYKSLLLCFSGTAVSMNLFEFYPRSDQVANCHSSLLSLILSPALHLTFHLRYAALGPRKTEKPSLRAGRRRPPAEPIANSIQMHLTRSWHTLSLVLRSLSRTEAYIMQCRTLNRPR